MTTAYTSLLGLALPVTGELSGTWGDVVNNSITGLLDTAVAGTTTLSTDADVTLSTTTGAANQSRQAIILWTASGTVTRTITAPAQSKIYTIINRSSTQSIKIVGVGPTTGVTVKSGATVTVAWNGLDFVEISVSTLYPTVTISGNMDNGTTDNSLNNAPTVKSAVTTLASVYLSNPSTEAASFTLTSLVGYRAEQGTFGASSTVTNQYGFYANSDLTGAQFNYGLYSGIAATAASTITSVNGTGSTVTVDTSGSHGLVTGDSVIIAGVSNTTMTAGSYNGGPYTITLVDSNTFTFSSSATSSAAVTSGGSVVKANNWNIYAGGTGNNWFGGPVINSVSSVLPALRITQTGTGDALLVEDSTNPDSTPFVIDTSGNVIVGYTTAVATQNYGGFALTSNYQQHGTAQNTSTAAIFNWATSAGSPPNLILNKSLGGTVGTRGALTAAGNDIGAVTFNGDDGTNFIPAAAILVEADGTPGTNDMPGRFLFLTTADGASTPTERMRIDSAGNVGIATASVAGYRLLLGGVSTPSPSGNAYGVANSVSIQSDVTATYRSFRSSINTQATAFTLSNLYHFDAGSATIGAGSSLTNQVGFYAQALTGATNNYGFYGAIASGTGRYNFYAAGTAENFFGGNTIVEVTDNTNAALRITQLGTGNALLVEDSTNPDSTPFVIDASGNVIVGYTSTVATVQNLGSAITPLLQVQGSGASPSSAGLYNWSSSSSSSSTLAFNKSFSGVVGTRGALTTAGQDLGNVVFAGDDGTNFVAAVSILAEVDGTPGTNDMPGRLVFSTTADGASTPTERMRIDSLGNVGIGATTANYQKLGIGGTYPVSSNISEVVSARGDFPAASSGTDTFLSRPTTSGAIPTMRHFRANPGTFTGAVTNQFGFVADSSLTGATNNYGFYGAIASGTGRYNFYANGTAENFFGGNTVVSVTDNTNAALRITQLGTGNALLVEDSTNPDSTPFVIDANGRVITGVLAAQGSIFGGGYNPQIQVWGTGPASASQSFASFNTAGVGNGSRMWLTRSRGSFTAGVPTYGIVSNGDTLGDIQFAGDDGTVGGNFVTAAQILAQVDGIPGTNDMPGRLVFSTTADGASTITERMRIDSSGNVQVQSGAVMPYAPAPASISGTATLTNANIQAQIINTTGTSYTVTMPLGTTLETLATWATTNIGYDFFVINTASGTITINGTVTGVTSLGSMTITTGTSAQFRIRRTAANTFVLYRLG